MAFLKTVATELYNIHRAHLHRLLVVFPNRRQSIFFRHYFLQVAEPPAFMPQMLTIEQLVAQSAAMPAADSLLQSFELYKAYKTICLEEGEEASGLPDYEQFFPIGETLLKDFSEMDAYLLNVSEVCSVLYNIETIEKAFDQLSEEQKSFLKQFWASVTHKGAAQERFLKLWKRLPAIYQLFHQQLEAIGFTTLGKSYRSLATNKHSPPEFSGGWQHVAFVGFNAFNKAEETFLQQWQSTGFASLWFDADEYYLSDKKQEAGYFLRRNLEKIQLKNELPVLNRIRNHPNTITVKAVQGHTAQAKIIADWLQLFPPGNPIETSAILLADESLILPVLQSLPGNDIPVNVTMGYPLQQTAVFSFFNLYFTIQADLAKNRWLNLHFELVQEWLHHPLCDLPEEFRLGLLQKIVQQVLVRVPLKMLFKKSAITDLVLLKINAEADVFGRLRQMFQIMQQQPALQDDALLQGAIVGAWQVLQTAEPLFEQLKPTPSLNLVVQVLRRHLSTITIPFEGEPLSGIQVMGLLESRGLDFKHILILGAAEGTLPRINAPQTFLPDGVRRAFGLPVPEFQDAIFAYTFYRLLHRCETMQLAYNALVSDNGTGEPSRFIQQLQFETNIPFRFEHPGTVVKPSALPVISIEKTPEIFRFLNKYLLSEKPVSVSPSQVNTYISCRLQYFFKYLASLKKPDTLSEEVDAATLGSIVHEIMEQLYARLKDHQGDWMVTKDSINWMRQQVGLVIEPAFRKVWMNNKPSSPIEFIGLLEVIKQVVEKYVEGFLAIDETHTPFTVESLEVTLPQPFAIQMGNQQKKLLLNGKIDRVDEKDGLYRMVDYKTGGDKTAFHDVESLFERDGKKQNKAALQTLIYSWMFQKQFPQHKRFEPALVPLREINKTTGDTRLVMNSMKTAVTADNVNDILLDVEENLRLVLQEIFDPSVPFDQTTNPKICEYCDYKGICKRC
ncbi:MAG: PD-(D/E)XK nuclease family protein [Bacteroidota bacterium]